MSWIKRIDFKRWAFANFLVLAAFGTLLRYMMCFPFGNLKYLYILHAHSHFAFAGWMFIALGILISRKLDEEISTAFRWILLLALICSFGMLISFSLQGYKAVSIIFSTLFLFVSYWFGYLVYTRWNTKDRALSTKLIKASVGFMMLSSIGPLALGILKATGNTGFIYENAIYFYLHFQMNGWMVLAALALIAGKFLNLNYRGQKAINTWLNTFILSTIPLFLIFTLWSKPASWVFLIAILAALVNVLSWFIIIRKLKSAVEPLPLLIRLALIAISVKVVFQVLVCIPLVGEWTFLNRNLIIGYVHLITLACVTPVIIDQFVPNPKKIVDWFYSLLTITYLVLLFIQPALSLLQIAIPSYHYYLLIISVLYCLLGISYYIQVFYPRSTSILHTKYLNKIVYENNN